MLRPISPRPPSGTTAQRAVAAAAHTCLRQCGGANRDSTRLQAATAAVERPQSLALKGLPASSSTTAANDSGALLRQVNAMRRAMRGTLTASATAPVRRPRTLSFARGRRDLHAARDIETKARAPCEQSHHHRQFGTRPGSALHPERSGPSRSFSVATTERWTDQQGQRQERPSGTTSSSGESRPKPAGSILEQGPPGVRRRRIHHAQLRRQGRQQALQAPGDRGARRALPRRWWGRRRRRRRRRAGGRVADPGFSAPAGEDGPPPDDDDIP